MYNVFNMGIGFTLVVDTNDEAKVLNTLQQAQVNAYRIGEIVKSEAPIHLTGYESDKNCYLCFRVRK